MGLRDNRDTIIANLAQQGCSLLIFLVVPHLLAVEQFGQVTFVNTLLSFIGLADFGFSYIYARSMPGVYGRNEPAEVAWWNGHAIRFRVYCSIIFALVISVVYYAKYHDAINACLIFLVAPMTTITACGLAAYVAKGDFSSSRNVTVVQAVTRLVAVPAVKLLGLYGWFFSQLISVASGLLSRGFFRSIVNCWRDHSQFEMRRILAYLPEAIALGLVATLWLQLVSAARLYAVMSYSDAQIASYGLASTAYQIISTLVIAAFAPQTVKTYRMLEADVPQAMHYVFRIVLLAFPVIGGMSILAAVAAPWFFARFFPQYAVSSDLLTPVLLSLMSYPAIVVLGAALVGSRRSYPYAMLVVGWFVGGFAIFQCLRPHFGNLAAAHAQFLLIPLYAISLILMVYFYFRRFIRKPWMVWAAIGSNMLAPVAYYGWLWASA